MVEGTRFKLLDEHVHALELKLQEMATGHDQKFEELHQKIGAMQAEEQSHYEFLRREAANSTKRWEQLMDLLTNQQQCSASKGATTTLSPESRGILPTPPIPLLRDDSSAFQFSTKNNISIPIPRLEFPNFSGDNPRNWVRRCEKYFEIHGITDSQRLEIAAMHLEHEQIFGSMGIWQRKENFLSGLKEEIRASVKMFKPSTLEQAYEQAGLQEQSISAMMKKSKILLRNQGSTQLSSYKGNSSITTNRTSETPKYYTSKFNTERAFPNRQLIEQRRAAGLCFKCGDRYFPGHQCRTQSINTVTATPEVTEVYDEISLRELTEQEEAGMDEEKEEVGCQFMP
uniref:Retrotransposon gag domain-containing protein n=1 Tax=Ananas comosus var. bracteatus TaxID=296719 RepID=A0A6V7PI84_ANACO|nr:unnamed protein product [Ananas comosus var. bracteatus]